MTPFPPRRRRVRIVATLGPASRTQDQIRALVVAGADVFRINMSHGDQADRTEIINSIRAIEQELRRPMTILVDLQGPKLRLGTFANGPVHLHKGERFRLDRDPTPGDATRAYLPHDEVFAALKPGARLLVDDGKLALRTLSVHADYIETEVIVAGKLSNHKGVNVPDVLIPLAALTEKDRRDLAFALEIGADWIALSFVQRPEDVAEAKALVGGRAGVLAKLEKPAAIDDLEAILHVADAVMVARGDLGVELPAAEVPPIQKRIVAMARAMGKPVVVATQMLESMITSPTPTRAEVSDVANAIYDGADAVMLSAESAAGAYPVEAVAMMDEIATQAEADPDFHARLHFKSIRPNATAEDAISAAAASGAETLGAQLVCCFTTSGATARRVARERPPTRILVLTPKLTTARRLGLVWGVHAVHARDVDNLEEMIAKTKRMALRTGLAHGGDCMIMIAGYPFGTPGTTNLLHIAQLQGDELG